MSRYNLEDALELYTYNKIGEIFTAMPGRVISYDVNNTAANVEILLSKRYQDDFIQEYPPLTNVPVIFPRAGNKGFLFNLDKDDPVLILFTMRAIDKYLYKGEKNQEPPESRRRYDVNDAVCIPGFYPFTGPMTSGQVKPLGALSMFVDNTQLAIQDDGKLSLIAQDDVTIDINGKHTLQVDGESNVTLNSTSNVTINGDANIDVSGTTNLTCSNDVNIECVDFNVTGDMKVSGSMNATGVISSDNDVVSNSISLTTHIHGGVQTGGGFTGQPS